MYQYLTNYEASLQIVDDSGWSFDEASALVEYLEELEMDVGPMEFLPGALSLEYQPFRLATKALEERLRPEAFREFMAAHTEEDTASTHKDIEDAAEELLLDQGFTVIQSPVGIIVSTR